MAEPAPQPEREGAAAAQHGQAGTGWAADAERDVRNGEQDTDITQAGAGEGPGGEPIRSRDKKAGEHGFAPEPSSPYAQGASSESAPDRGTRPMVRKGNQNAVATPRSNGGAALHEQGRNRLELAQNVTNPHLRMNMLERGIRETIAGINLEFRNHGQQFTEEDARKIAKEPPQIPSFPFIMVGIAILKDVLDVIDNITLVGIVLSFFLSVIISLILTVWSWNKMGGWWWKKYIINWFWQRFAFSMLVEFTPFLQVIPTTTILVLMTHYHETKVVKLLNMAFERLRSAGVLKYMV